MIQVFVLSPLDEVWERIKSLQLNPTIIFSRWNKQMLISEIKAEESAFDPILLIDDTAMDNTELEIFLHKLRANQSNISIGYLVSYGKEAKASQLLRAQLVHFFLQRRFHASLLLSELFAVAYQQVSFSASLHDLLELALDHNCAPVAEKIAEIKQLLSKK